MHATIIYVAATVNRESSLKMKVSHSVCIVPYTFCGTRGCGLMSVHAHYILHISTIDNESWYIHAIQYHQHKHSASL